MAMTGSCHGNGERHCCHYRGEVCKYLEEHTVVGRRWACGLLREYGSWKGVYASEEYRELAALRHWDFDCGDWPQELPREWENNRWLCCFEPFRAALMQQDGVVDGQL
jgi:hypothetical protein